MGGYDADEMDGWEFKVLRSPLGRFRNQQYLHEVLDLEAIAGWDLLEKLDDRRLRLRRRTEWRSATTCHGDPYRTVVGAGAMHPIEKTALIVLGTVIVTILCVMVAS